MSPLSDDPRDAVPPADPVRAPGGDAADEADVLAEEPDEPAETLALRHAFPCERCGARLTWDPDRDALACAWCGHEHAVPRAGAAIVERPLAEAGAAARGLGLETRVARCTTCGAEVAFGGAAIAAACTFCGSDAVLDRGARRNALRPESLIPLDVGRAAAEAGFRKWIGGLWFRPSALKRATAIEAVGVYVPYWTFDCAVHSDWSADAGHSYWVTQTYTTRVNGRSVVRTRRVRKVRWVPAWGARDDRYDDHLVNASAAVDEGVARELGAFDLAALVPYRPEYLAGWRAEEYRVDLEAGWSRARAELVERQRARCAADVPGDTHRRLEVSCRFDDVRWKHVLLPMWSLAYTFRGKTWPVLVHGQSGRVAGKAPLSWAKIALVVLAVLAVVGLVALVASGAAAVGILGASG